MAIANKINRKYPGRIVEAHAHSHYSDGQKFDYVKIKSSDLEAVAKTEHGNVDGLIEHYKEMKKIGKVPILGVEFYVENIIESLLDISVNHTRKSYHLTILIRTETGFKNVLKLVTLSERNKVGKNKVLKFQDLVNHKDGLICLSGCIAGEIPQYFANGQDKYAETLAGVLQELFQDDFYLEIQRHELKEEELVNPGLIKLSEKLGIALVATTDAHYLTEEDAIIHEILRCKKFNKTINDPKRLKLPGKDYALLTSVAFRENKFKDIPQALDSGIEIMEKCKDLVITDACGIEDYHFPKFESPEPYNSQVYFIKKCTEGFDMKVSTSEIEETKEYRERLDREIAEMMEAGYEEYLLIVADIIEFARKNNIWTGPGRGSAAGSFLSYVLGITKLDPIKNKFLFERFYNKARKNMPDIDLDIESERRYEVINYVYDKYDLGEDTPNIAFIRAYNTSGAKNSINDVGKILEYSNEFTRGISKLIPNIPKITIDEALQSSKELKERYHNEEDVKIIVDYAKRIEGTITSTSKHAAGIIIADKPLDNYGALTLEYDEELGREIAIIQYDAPTAESRGLLKIDLLSLATGSEIADTLRMINEKKEHECLERIENLDNIPLDDKNVYDNIFAKGNTTAVFQCESRGMTKVLSSIFSTIKNLSKKGLDKALIDRFLGLMHGISLERPGTRHSIPEFLSNLENIRDIEYPHKKTKKHLEETCGILIYQEQVSILFQELAGYPLELADIVRAGISKKKIDLVEAERDSFIYGKEENGVIIIPGCIRNGIDKETATKLFDDMVDFGKYAFNRSHAGSYALVAYQTAYLKNYYPVEYMTAILTGCCRGNASRKKLSKYIQECFRMGIKILPPDVNESDSKFTVQGENTIRFGLRGIKYLGIDVAELIEKERKENGRFKDTNSFAKRISNNINTSFNTRNFQALALSGALDNLSNTRKYNYENAEKILKKSSENSEVNLFDVLSTNVFDSILGIDSKTSSIGTEKQVEYSTKEKLVFEEEYIGGFISEDPLSKYKNIIEDSDVSSLCDIMINVDEEEDDENLTAEAIFKNNDTVKIIGFVTSLEVREGQKPYIIYKVSDGTKTISGIANIKYKNNLQVGNIVHISGKVKHDPVHGTELKYPVVSRVFNAEDDIYTEDEVIITKDSTVVAYINHYSQIPKFTKVLEYDKKSNSKTELYFSCNKTKQKFLFNSKISLKNADVLNFLKENTTGLIIR